MVAFNNLKVRPMPTQTEELLDKFWSNVIITANPKLCWEWSGWLNGAGYGRLYFNGVEVSSHRMAYFIHTKIDPLEMLIRHQCHNKRCCNPEHLLAGSVKDNLYDSLHTLWSNGKEIWTAKLTQENVKNIVYDYINSTLTQAELAQKYNITETNISRIVTGKTWKHIVKDKILRFRKNPFGENSNCIVKLNEAQVLNIRSEYLNGGISQKALGKKYGVTQSQINLIVLRKSWKHLQDKKETA